MPQYDIWHIYDEMEKYLMASMSRNLKRHLKEEAEYGFDWEQWQAAKLREMRKFRKQNQKIIGKHTKNLAPDIKQHLENEYKQGLVGVAKKYAEQFGENKFTKDLSDGFFGTYDEKVKALINAVNDDLKAANHAALRMTNDAYRQVIHKAAMFAGNGVMTEKQAIDMALQDFKKRGLNCIKYKNGARHNIKEYADMALRTAEMRAMLIGEGKARQELGETLVQISRHGTACPLCVPWENKVLIDDVYSGGTWENSKAKYEQLPESKRGESPFLSKAMLAGLYHPRCRHGLGTYYIELQEDYKPIEAEKPKEPEKTAEEIAAEEAAAKAAKLAQQEAEKMAKFKQLYNLNWEDTLTPEQMAKITALEDDLMIDGNFEEYEQWAAKKQAELQTAYEEAYKWYGKDYGSLSYDEQQKYDAAFNSLIDADLTKTPQKQQKKFEEWAANRAKLEAEAKAAKIKADTEKLHKALYTGQTGPDIDALKQSILDDAEYLDAYNAMAEPIYDGAKAELNFKNAILKDAKKAVADAEAAEKAAKKAAKDAQDAADMAANDAAIGWLPNYDKAYFAKYGKYPIHTDPNYIINKNKWRSAKYTSGLDGADLEAIIEQMADSDLPNYELKKAAMQKEAADKAAELAAKKAEKKAAKKAEKQAQIEADKAQEEFDKAKRALLKEIDEHVIIEGKNVAQIWKRRKNEFAYEIDDIVDFQGFNGLPRVVPPDEFEQYAAKSAFVGHRGYSNKSKQVLEQWKEELRTGDWYINCSTGGAQYGQGMYVAADYTPDRKYLAAAFKEANDYADRRKGYRQIETFCMDESANILYVKGTHKGMYGNNATRADCALAVAQKYVEMNPELYGYANFASMPKSVYDKEVNDLATKLVWHGDPDMGTLAASLGYDAISSDGHGASRNYTVVLNRTKLIIKGE